MLPEYVAQLRDILRLMSALELNKWQLTFYKALRLFLHRFGAI